MGLLLIKVLPKCPQSSNEILNDLITSAAFFENRDIDFHKFGEGFKFLLPEEDAGEYLYYLDRKYKLRAVYYDR